MIFGQPWVLFFLLAPALLLTFVWKRRGRRIALPFDHGRPGTGRVLATLVQSGESLPPLLGAVAVILLAGPQHLSAPKVRRALTNIQFCIDISGSMTSPFGSGSRYDASMAAINRFLDYRKGDAFGLTFFGNNVLHWVPLTNDVSAFRCAPPFMRPENAPPWFGGTEIGKALLACREVLTSRQEGDRMIILITDGISADLFGDRDQEIARTLRADRIAVYSVHAAEPPIPDPIVNITSITGGQAFNPDDPTALDTVFQRIDAMQATRLEKATAEYVDDFAPWCLGGLVLLGLHALLQLWLRYTPW